MIKVVFAITRRSDLSPEEFRAYWHDVHSPIVTEVADTLRIRRYVQTHPILPTLAGALATVRGASTGYDGIAELWWDSAADMRADTSEARVAAGRLLADEKNFINLAESVVFLGEERTII